MKKFTLVLAVVLASVMTAGAATHQLNDGMKAKQRHELFTPKTRLDLGSAAMRKAPQKAEEYTPTVAPVNYSMNLDDWYNGWDTYEDYFASSFYFEEDGTVYMTTISPYCYSDGLLKGEMDGSDIVLTFPIEANLGGYDFIISTGSYDEENDDFNVTNEDYRFTVTDDGIVSADPDLSLIFYVNYYGDGEYWLYGADRNYSMTPVEVETTTVPEGLTMETFTKQYENGYGSTSFTQLNVAVDGSDIYVQGLFPSAETAWVKGQIDGDKVVFPADPCLGIISGYIEYGAFSYFEGGNIYYGGVEGEFTYDPDTRVMTYDNYLFTVDQTYAYFNYTYVSGITR